MSNELSFGIRAALRMLVIVSTVMKIIALIFLAISFMGMIFQLSVSRLIVVILIAAAHVLFHFAQNGIETRLYCSPKVKATKQLERKEEVRENNE